MKNLAFTTFSNFMARLETFPCEGHLLPNVLSTAFGVLVTGLLFLFSYKFVVLQHSETSISKHVRWLSISLIVTTLLESLETIYDYLTCFNQRSSSSSVLGVVWVINCLLVLIIFLTRLYDVFNDSIYAYSHNIFIVSGTVILLLFIAGMTASVLLQFNPYISIVIFIIGLGFYFLFALVILWLFMYGLFKVTLVIYIYCL